MKKTIVIINGTGSCGKDTVDEIVSKYHKTYRIDSVEIPKYILGLRCVGLDGVKTPEARIALSKLKKVLSEFNDCIFINMTARVEVFMADSFYFDDVYAFVHIREKPEIDRLHDYCVDRGYSVKKCLVLGHHDRNWGNDSDDNPDYFNPDDYDIVLYNDGDKDSLEEQVKREFHLGKF